jgi:hypothetical protein
MPTFRNTLSVPSSEDEDGTVCSETSAYKLQTPGNYPEESIQQMKILIENLEKTYGIYERVSLTL